MMTARRVLGALAAAVACFGAEVTKVEPPSWWAGSTVSPVRLLVRGAGLTIEGMKAQAPLSMKNGRVNEKGTYLFADLLIPKTVKPGKYKLSIAGANAEFEVLPALDREGKFAGFSNEDFLYLIMPDRFANGDRSNDDPPSARGLLDRSKARYYHGGDFQGVVDRIPYLKEMGVTAVWFNPWYDNVDHLNAKERYNNEDITDYHGYGAIDYYGVDQHLGDMKSLREMVDRLRAAGIKTVQDQVANHTGPYHAWVKDPPLPAWFNGSESVHLANTWQTWTLMDPNGTNATRRATLEGWFIDILPDMNQNDPEARRYLIQNSLWWMGVAGFDGIRQDTMPYAPRDYWRDWMAAVKREFPNARVVGEVLDGNPAFVSFYQGGRKGFDGIDTGVDSMFDFPLMFAMRKAYAQEGPVRDVAQVLAHDHLYPDPHMLITFPGLHDVPRFMGERGATTAGLMLSLATVFTVRGVPMIYYGDEIAMAGAGDPDNRRDFPGGWNEDARSAFSAAGRTSDENLVFEYVKRLAALRKGSAALKKGRMMSLLASEQQWVFARKAGDEIVMVAINNGPASADCDVDVREVGLGDGTSLSDKLGGAGSVRVEAGKAKLKLAARSAAVFTR
jgi:glycosidase